MSFLNSLRVPLKSAGIFSTKRRMNLAFFILVVLHGNAPCSYANLAIKCFIRAPAFFKLQDHVSDMTRISQSSVPLLFSQSGFAPDSPLSTGVRYYIRYRRRLASISLVRYNLKVKDFTGFQLGRSRHRLHRLSIFEIESREQIAPVFFLTIEVTETNTTQLVGNTGNAPVYLVCKTRTLLLC